MIARKVMERGEGITDTRETYVLELRHRNPHLNRKLAGEK